MCWNSLSKVTIFEKLLNILFDCIMQSFIVHSLLQWSILISSTCDKETLSTNLDTYFGQGHLFVQPMDATWIILEYSSFSSQETLDCSFTVIKNSHAHVFQDGN